jgi:hypothetical protein
MQVGRQTRVSPLLEVLLKKGKSWLLCSSQSQVSAVCKQKGVQLVLWASMDAMHVV